MDLNKRVAKTETISVLNGYRENNDEPYSRVKWTSKGRLILFVCFFVFVLFFFFFYGNPLAINYGEAGKQQGLPF